MAMVQSVSGCIGFFDPGTSQPSSISLWFRSTAVGAGTSVLHEPRNRWDQEEQTTSSNVNSPPNAFLPKHRTWSGGLLFTLPETYKCTIPAVNGIVGFHSSDGRNSPFGRNQSITG